MFANSFLNYTHVCVGSTSIYEECFIIPILADSGAGL